MSTPTIYVTNSIQMVVIAVGALALTLAIVVACCSLINWVVRRPLLNGWLWGAATVALLVTYHFAMVYSMTASAAGEQNTAVTHEAFALGLTILLFLAIAIWRSVVWWRKHAVPRA